MLKPLSWRGHICVLFESITRMKKGRKKLSSRLYYHFELRIVKLWKWSTFILSLGRIVGCHDFQIPSKVSTITQDRVHKFPEGWSIEILCSRAFRQFKQLVYGKNAISLLFWFLQARQFYFSCAILFVQ